MNFVTALKRSGSVQIKRILVPLSNSATVSATTTSDSQPVDPLADHNISEPTCPYTIGIDTLCTIGKFGIVLVFHTPIIKYIFEIRI